MDELEFDENGMLIVNEEAPQETPEEAPQDGQPATPEGGLGMHVLRQMRDALPEARRAVVGGVRDGVQEMADAGQSFLREDGRNLIVSALAGPAVSPQDVDMAYEHLTGGGSLELTRSGGVEWLGPEEVLDRGDDIIRLIGDDSITELPEVAENETMPGQMARSTIQFLTGFSAAAGVGRGMQLANATTTSGRILQATAQGAVADATAFDPYEDRVSDFMRDELGLQDPITEFLQADPEDTEAEGRFKNALEGAALGLGTDAIFALMRGYRGAARINQEQGPQAAAAHMEEVMANEPLLLTPEQRVDAPVEEPRPPVDVERLTASINRELGLRSGGSLPDPYATPDGTLFNFSRMDSDVEVRQMLEMASQAVPTERLVGTTTFDAMQRDALNYLADSVDVDPDVIDRSLAQLASTAEQQSAVIIAGRSLVQSLSAEVERVAHVIHAGRADEETRNLFVQLQSRLVETSGNLKSAITGAAQATASGRIRTSDVLTGSDLAQSDILRQMRENIQQAGGNGTIDDMARAVVANRANRGGPRGLMRIAEGITRPMDMFNEVWINALLSGPKTHVINALSNAMNSVMLPAERMIGGALTLDSSMVGEGFRQYVGLITALGDSFRMAGVALRQGRNILDPEAAILEANGNNFQAIRSNSDDPIVRGLVNFMGGIVRLPSRGLLAGDEFFKQINYRSQLSARLSSEAQRMVQAGQLSRQDAASWVEERLRNGIASDGSASDQTSLQYAREATFTQELRPGSMSRGIQNATNRFPALKLIFPFVRTPTNILLSAVQRTPLLNVASRNLRDDFFSGDPGRRASAIGKTFLGGAAWAQALNLAVQGNITGAGPSDPAARSRLMETGWRPYSFRLEQPGGGVEYVEYRRLEPFAIFLGIAADIADIGGQIGEAEMGDLAASAAIGLANNITSKTYLQGLVDVVNAVSDPQRSLMRTLSSYASSMIPFSAAMREMRRQQDPYLREVRSLTDALMNTVPGYSDDLPARRSWITGLPISYPRGWGADMASPLGDAFASANPIIAGDWAQDAVLDELAAVQGISSAPTRRIQGIELTTAQYSRLQELHGTTRLGRYTMYQRLERLFETSSYQNLPTNVSDPSLDRRVDMINRVISQYREAARAVLIREEPELRAAIQEQQRELAMSRRSSFNSIAEIGR